MTGYVNNDELKAVSVAAVTPSDAAGNMQRGFHSAEAVTVGIRLDLPADNRGNQAFTTQSTALVTGDELAQGGLTVKEMHARIMAAVRNSVIDAGKGFDPNSGTFTKKIDALAADGMQKQQAFETEMGSLEKIDAAFRSGAEVGYTGADAKAVLDNQAMIGAYRARHGIAQPDAGYKPEVVTQLHTQFHIEVPPALTQQTAVAEAVPVQVAAPVKAATAEQAAKPAAAEVALAVVLSKSDIEAAQKLVRAAGGDLRPFGADGVLGEVTAHAVLAVEKKDAHFHDTLVGALGDAKAKAVEDAARDYISSGKHNIVHSHGSHHAHVHAPHTPQAKPRDEQHR